MVIENLMVINIIMVYQWYILGSI